MREFVEVFKHQQPFVAEMAMEAFKENGIACFMQQGTVTVLVLSPVAPAAGIGIEYIVYVHLSRLEEAKEIVNELPIDKELLNVKWIKSPDSKRQRLIRLYWLLALVIPTITTLIVSIYVWLIQQ